VIVCRVIKESAQMHGNVRAILMNFVTVILKLVMLDKEHIFKCVFIYNALSTLSDYIASTDRKTGE
jgi:hypothetical protein